MVGCKAAGFFGPLPRSLDTTVVVPEVDLVLDSFFCAESDLGQDLHT